MATETALPWQEIITPAVPPPWWHGWPLTLLLLVLLAVLIWVWRRWWNAPPRRTRRRLSRIRRDLLHGRLEPRHGLNQAAAVLGAMDPQRRGVLSLRFSRQAPGSAQAAACLERVLEALREWT